MNPEYCFAIAALPGNGRRLLIALLAFLAIDGSVPARAQELADSILASRPSMVGRAFDNPISVQGRFEEDLRAAISASGRDSLQAADAMMLLGHATVDTWDKHRQYDTALNIARLSAGERHPLYGRYLLEAASSLIDHDAYRRGDDYLERARAYFAAAFPNGTPEAARVPLLRGLMSERQESYREAANWFARAATLSESFADDPPAQELLKTAHASAVRVLELNGDRERATPHCVALAALAAHDGNALPQQLLLVPPEYPGKLLRKQIEGAVTFSFTVDAGGMVEDVKIEQIEGPDEFGDALLEAIGRWRFTPRFKDGVPVSARLRNRYLFTREEGTTR